MKKKFLALSTVAIALIVAVLAELSRSPQTARTTTAVLLPALLGDNDQGFEKVNAPWPFQFPDDHGAHPAFRTESWYFTGHLVSEQGRRFGFQLTFFRLALTPEPPESVSAWATHQIYRAHFALTDINNDKSHAFERFSRQALGLSGAESMPARVWVENWSVSASGRPPEKARFDLLASEGAIDLALKLQAIKPAVLPEDTSIVPGGGSGGAFHFYLLSRMSAQGTLRIGDDMLAVTGTAWLDRAWGAVPVSRGQIALNRFALQLDDGVELLCFQLHRRDGTGTPVTTGLLIRANGAILRLGRRDIDLEALDDWSSPRDGTRYPARWRLRVPSQRIELDLSPAVADQELDLSVRYWSGAVTIDGKTAEGNVTGGVGYVELTGYANGALRL